MISFSLTEEQKELRALAGEFAEKEIRPGAAECDVAMRHPAEIIEKAHQLGLMNLHVPEAYGGPGLSVFDGMLVGEELYWGCSGIGTSITANGLGAGPVIGFGSDEQKRTWLTPLIEQPILCSFGLSEPGAGSDVASLKTTAVRGDRCPDPRTTPVELLAHEHSLERGEARPTELDGDVEVHQPERVRLLDHLGGVAHRDVALGLERPDLLLGELAREGAQLLLLLGECEGNACRRALVDCGHGNSSGLD